MSVMEKDKVQDPPGERAVSEIPVPPEPKRWRVIALAGVLLVALMIVVGVVLAAGGGDETAGPASQPAAAPAPAKPAAAAPAAATAGKIGVTLADFTVAPTPASVRAGHVTFRVHNAGAVGHEFVVVRTNKSAAGLLKGSEANEAGNVGEIGGLKPGATKSLRLDLKAGHYALLCNLPGHYQAGQHADFVVK
jgi:uncharacterized cupredoxin-like copper-binding protein